MRKLYLFLIVTLLSFQAGFSQLSGTKTIGVNYTSIAAAISALNAQGVGTGGVTFNIPAGYTETFTSATAGRIITSGTSSKPIIFQKSGSGTNPKITAYVQDKPKDTLKEISTIGVFDGKIIKVGNFDKKDVYMINDYCISLTDISSAQADSLKGKKILVTGKLKIVDGNYTPARTSTDGTIYEPYKEPDKKFISFPVFTIVYNDREPLLNKLLKN